MPYNTCAVQIPLALKWIVGLVGWLCWELPDQGTAVECIGLQAIYVQLVMVPLIPLVLDCPSLLAKKTAVLQAPESMFTTITASAARSTISWGTWIFLAPASVKICMSMLECKSFPGLPGSYLVADYSVRCDRTIHSLAKAYALFFLVIFLVVLPGFLAIRNLRSCREAWQKNEIVIVIAIYQ